MYTQMSDVETECDGLLSYDRGLKVDPTRVRAATQQLLRSAQEFYKTL